MRNSRVFSITTQHFASMLRESAVATGVRDSDYVSSHALRRGMAQDLVDSGCSLATLLHAGGWRSAAFLKYLRDSQLQEAAVAQVVIQVSESEDDV